MFLMNFVKIITSNALKNKLNLLDFLIHFITFMHSENFLNMFIEVKLNIIIDNLNFHK